MRIQILGIVALLVMASDSVNLRVGSSVGPYKYQSMIWWGYYMATNRIETANDLSR